MIGTFVAGLPETGKGRDGISRKKATRFPLTSRRETGQGVRVCIAD